MVIQIIILDNEDLISQHSLKMKNINESINDQKDLRIELDKAKRENYELFIKLSDARKSLSESQMISLSSVKNSDSKFDDFDAFMLRKEINDNSEEEKYFETIEKLSLFAKNLFIDYIFAVHLLENSISLSHLNGVILNKVSYFMNTIFIENDKNNPNLCMSSTSLIQEYLEDFFLRINNYFLLKKDNKLKKENDIIIEQKDLTNEFLLKISEDIIKSNIISNQIKCFSSNTNHFSVDLGTSLKTLITKLLTENIHKINNNSVQLIFQEYLIKKEIKVKINGYSSKLLDQTLQVANACKNCIDKGRIIYNKKEIYKFNKTIINSHSQEKEFIIEDKIDTYVKLDSIQMKLKYNCRDIQILILSQVFNNSSLEINRFSFLIINYCKHLSRLSLTDNIFSEKQFYFICQIIHFKRLISIDLSRNQLKDNNISLLCQVLETHNYLQYLDLSKNQITSKGIVFLSDALKSNTKLEKIYLASNSFNNLGFNSLVETLVTKNKTIQYLSIADNNLYNDHSSICKLLKSNNEIRYLNLSSINFHKESLKEISNAMKQNKSLKYLYMENCDLYSDKLANLFNSFSSLKLLELHLSDNMFGESEIREINKMLEQNNCLKIISLKNCNLTTPLLISIIRKIGNEVEKLDVRNNKFSFDKELVSTLINVSTSKKSYLLININDLEVIELFSKSDRIIIY